MANSEGGGVVLGVREEGGAARLDGLTLERHADRFVMENPGTLLVSLELYHRGGVSECRNKALQQMFLLIGGGERAGSGADKIRAGWRSQHWRAPLIVTQHQPDRVCLTLPMISLIPDVTLERLRTVFGVRLDTLSPAETQALATADLEDGVSNVRLQELLPDHPADITHMLQGLCGQGFLLSDNRRRWTMYRLAAAPPGVADSSHRPGDSSHRPGDSSHMGSGTEAVALQALADSLNLRRRMPPGELRRLILRLCEGRFLSAQDLSQLLRRDPSNLRSRHLTPLVEEGALCLRYPASPTRPDQAYTTARQP